jgi:hypothetical protein
MGEKFFGHLLAGILVGGMGGIAVLMFLPDAPPEYIGGAAGVGFLLGFVIGPALLDLLGAIG